MSLSKPPDVLGCHTASTANSTVEEDTCHHRVVKHQQHLTADNEEPQSAEEESALSLLHLSVGGPVKLVVEVHT